jgi:uncharacterized membrane protein
MAYQPTPTRLESFSDGVIAVIITIMVLEFKVPAANGLAGLVTLLPTLAVYLLSYVFVGIYWVNHHHLVGRLKHADHLILWANLFHLFFLSLTPFFTNYMVVKLEDSFSVAVYTALLLVLGLSFSVLQFAVARSLRLEIPDAPDALSEQLTHHATEQRKSQISIVMYLAGIGLAYVHPVLSLVSAALVALLWIVPTFSLERSTPSSRHPQP